jgi:hypothetical protein
MATIRRQPVFSLRLLRFSALGFGVSFLCCLPPLIHFLTGPIGPWLGGFLAGTESRAEPAESLLIGLGMGLMGDVVVGIVVAVFTLTPLREMAPPDVDPRGFTLLAMLAVASYFTLAGSIGALFGGRRARKRAAVEQG